MTKASSRGSARTGLVLPEADPFKPPAGLGEFIRPESDRVWVKYLEQVTLWHGYMRLLMLPSEEADVRMTEMYVPLSVSPQWLPPTEKEPSSPRMRSALQALREHQRLVVLGDPGSGKSTLVNWMASQLARADGNEIARSFYPDRERLIPLPLILRELQITRGITWDGLVDLFVQQHPLTTSLDRAALRERLNERLAVGQVFVLIDGLDEVGNLDTRRDLRTAIWGGMRRFSSCRWLLTSRVVGYDDVRFDVDEELPAREPEESSSRESDTDHECQVTDPTNQRQDVFARIPENARVCELTYVAPFTDEQISQFSHHWYALRDPNSARAAAESQRFHDKLKSNAATVQLARTPHLLTFMAVIFRARAHLPDGRSLLFNEITHAYLEAIDRYRGLTEWAAYPFDQKKRWLARVGYKLQLQRVSELKTNHQATANAGQREILVDANTLRVWIGDAMTESGYDASQADRFVDFVQRRSGLLIPRGVNADGEEQFAFLHLSLQEYFAACYLEEQITTPRWIRTGDGPPGTNRDDLRVNVNDPTWRETFVFLFELLSARPGWPEDLCEQLFGRDFSDLESLADDRPSNARILLAQLATNVHSGLPESVWKRAIELCITDSIRFQASCDIRKLFSPTPTWIALLHAESIRLDHVWTTLHQLNQQTPISRLSLSGCPLSDLSQLSQLANLDWLNLANTSVSDVSPLVQLANLQTLDLGNTSVSDVSPLAQLANLQTLELSYTSVSDVSPLSRLANLQSLFLHNTSVSDVSPLAQLSKLRMLFLPNTSVSKQQVAQFHAIRQRLGLTPCELV